MGGHGGLNILPQKKWNVYNYDNRLKVEQDEAKEAIKKEEREMKSAKKQLSQKYAILKKQKGGREIKKVDDRRVKDDEGPSQHGFAPLKEQEKMYDVRENPEANFTIKEHLEMRPPAWYLEAPNNMVKVQKKVKKSKGIEDKGFYKEVIDPSKIRKSKYHEVMVFEDRVDTKQKKEKKSKKDKKSKKKKHKKNKNKKTSRDRSRSKDNNRIEQQTIEDKQDTLYRLRQERLEREKREKIRENRLLNGFK